MRKQKKTILWPVYCDSSRTRKEGRKVPKNAAVPNPHLTELQTGAENLGLEPEAESNATHPSVPWRKTGRVWVRKRWNKKQTLTRIAEEIVTIRQQKKK